MDTRVALIGIIIENIDIADRVNALLHNCGNYIVGRMGLPYREKNVNIISVVIDAPQDVISTLSGKLGAIVGIKAKVIYTSV